MRILRALPLLLIIPIISACAKLTPTPAPETERKTRTTAYEIRAELLAETHTLNVTTNIRYSIPQDGLGAVKLRAYANAYRGTPVTENKLSAAYPNGVRHGACEILSVSEGDRALTYDVGVDDPTVLTVRLGTPRKKGDEVTLCIDSVVTLANIKHRLGYAEDYYILSGFYPTVCPFSEGKYRTDPYYAYGDPFLHEVADYDVTLLAPKNAEAAASSLPTEIHTEGQTIIRRYEAEKLREFACVISSRLLLKEKKTEDLTVRYYYEKDSASADTLAYIEEAIRTYEEAFGAHPYPSFSVVQAPFFEAGMEFCGLALINKELSAAERKRTILHETAHEWWHGKVGNDEISHPWQDEALAEYSVLYFYKSHRAEALYDRDLDNAMDDYAIFAAIKGDIGVDHPLSLGEEGYAESTYRKGLLMMTSLAEKVGFEAVNGALKEYADTYTDCVATPEDLTDILSKLLDKEDKDYFEKWLYTTLPIAK